MHISADTKNVIHSFKIKLHDDLVEAMETAIAEPTVEHYEMTKLLLKNCCYLHKMECAIGHKAGMVEEE